MRRRMRMGIAVFMVVTTLVVWTRASVAAPSDWHNVDSPPPQCPFTPSGRNANYPTCLYYFNSGIARPQNDVDISVGVSVTRDPADPSGDTYFIDLSPSATQFDENNFTNV